MQGKIYKIVKILGRMNSRTVMMERFQDAEFSWHCCPQKIPRSVRVLYLLFTQPSLIRSFHSSDPCFSESCPKGVRYARVYCRNIPTHPLCLLVAVSPHERIYRHPTVVFTLDSYHVVGTFCSVLSCYHTLTWYHIS